MNNRYFFLSLEGNDYKTLPDNIIQEILKVQVQNGQVSCPNEIPLNEDESVHYKELKWLLDLIEPHVDTLIEAGVCFDNSSIWMTYGYFNQCNMEFDAIILKRIGDLGLKLCVSCYADEELTHRESFNYGIRRTPKKGVYVTTTTGIDKQIEQTISVSVKIENERNDSSFVFTSLDIDNDFMANFEIMGYDPEPKYVDSLSDYQVFCYDTIIPSNCSEKFSINLKAKLKGIFRGQLMVFEGGQYIEEALIVVIE